MPKRRSRIECTGVVAAGGEESEPAVAEVLAIGDDFGEEVEAFSELDVLQLDFLGLVVAVCERVAGLESGFIFFCIKDGERIKRYAAVLLPETPRAPTDETHVLNLDWIACD